MPMHKIILAPNAFKGSLDAPEVCSILTDVFRSLDIEVLSLPLGDGGDGTAGIIASYLHALPVEIKTKDALGRTHKSFYYRSENTAIIELAAICGIKWLCREEYDVLNASTAGLGIAICHAVENGSSEIIICLGGSASVDAGLGALQEMGLKIVKSTDKYNNHLIEIQNIDNSYLKEKFNKISIKILCDVDNMLCGPEGAASVFGPQKGASASQVSLLDKKLIEFSGLLLSTTRTDVTTLKHGGAAGGTAASFAALLNARLEYGSCYCIKISGFEKLLEEADLVVTGEGKTDKQTFYGKIPGEIARLCHLYRVPVYAVAGMADPGTNLFDRLYIMSEYAGSIDLSIKHPGQYLRLAGQDMKRSLPWVSPLS